jgi:hypothetical protein
VAPFPWGAEEEAGLPAARPVGVEEEAAAPAARPAGVAICGLSGRFCFFFLFSCDDGKQGWTKRTEAFTCSLNRLNVCLTLVRS